MTITYQVESLDQMFDEGMTLFKEHWDEVARNKDIIKQSIDYEMYSNIEKTGGISITTARDAGVLVGYNIHFINKHLHYRDDLFAVNDVLFVSKRYRKKGTGLRLMKFTDGELKKLGVSIIHMHMKIDHDFGSLVESLGYTQIEKVYEKVIK